MLRRSLAIGTVAVAALAGCGTPDRHLSSPPPTRAVTINVSVSGCGTGSASGDLTAARRDWPTGHLIYERLGAAYRAFGAGDSEINGLPNGLPGGAHDEVLTGFHRLEYGLWPVSRHRGSPPWLLPCCTRWTA